MAPEAKNPSAGGEAVGPSDESLASRSRHGDVAAFEVLVRRYQGRVYSYALRMTGDAHEAEDLAQETLLRVYRSLGRFDTRQPFAAWVFGIAAHVCRDWLRWRGRRREQVVETVDAVQQGASPAAEAAAAEERERVAKAVQRLPRKYREVIVLHYVEEMGYEQVAAALGIRPDAARRRALRARTMLERYLGGNAP
ncbi:MAG: RNA polymerase sigma factor [Planctomycetes bacterium]|nr:RNA polymerase sigma factor [Planctomycetota bacterium]